MKRSIKTIENVRIDDTFAIADYPSCKFFLPITETDTSFAATSTLNDLAGDQDIVFAQAIDETFTFATNGVTTAGTLFMASDQTETLPDLGTTNDLLFLVVADFNVDAASPFLITGAVADPALSLVRKSGTGTSFMMDTGGTKDSLTNTAIDANTEVAALYTVRATPRLFGVEGDGTTTTSPQDIALTATAGMDLDEGATSKAFFGTNTKVYGAAIFTFAPSTITDALAIVSWCNVQWRAGNKVLPPWLKNRT